ncbi:hypothetical protein DFJ74DRAFT_757084 [Hyaloraphidium curvatum]|nr:hypothetical protein DFJ74DRAFT_757084 [Hyaloraphidium curvatum]
MASEPPCDADFTPEEWVALFPAAGQPFLALGREEGEAASDRGAEFRNANPVTLAAMLAAFTNPALLLAASLAAGEPWAWATTGWRTVARSVLWVASALAIQGASAALSEGSFGARQIGVAMASLGLLAACGNLVVGMAAMAHPTLPRALDFAAPAGLCRWLQLTASEGAREIGAKGSRLVEHGPGDHLCPCRDCQRNVQSLAAFLVALDISHYSLILASSSVCLVWTAIVTFREAFWSTWWCCLLAAVWALITFVLTVVPGTFSRFLFHRNVAYDKLATRLHHRATTLAMRSLLDSLLGTTNGETRSDPDGHANADALSRKGAQWLYVHLHRRFADFCRGQSIQDNSIFNASILLIQLPATIVAIIANVVRGSCFARPTPEVQPIAPLGRRILHTSLAAPLALALPADCRSRRRQPRLPQRPHLHRLPGLHRRPARPPHREPRPSPWCPSPRGAGAARPRDRVVPRPGRVQGEDAGVSGHLRRREDGAGDAGDAGGGHVERVEGAGRVSHSRELLPGLLRVDAGKARRGNSGMNRCMLYEP